MKKFVKKCSESLKNVKQQHAIEYNERPTFAKLTYDRKFKNYTKCTAKNRVNYTSNACT